VKTTASKIKRVVQIALHSAQIIKEQRCSISQFGMQSFIPYVWHAKNVVLTKSGLGNSQIATSSKCNKLFLLSAMNKLIQKDRSCVSARMAIPLRFQNQKFAKFMWLLFCTIQNMKAWEYY